MVAIRQGEDLHLWYADGTQIIVEGFYAPDAADEFVLANGDRVKKQVTDEDEALLAEDGLIYLSEDGTASLLALTQGPTALYDAAEVTSSSTSSQVQAASSSAGGGLSTGWLVGLGVVGAAGVGLALAGGGDDSNSSGNGGSGGDGGSDGDGGSGGDGGSTQPLSLSIDGNGSQDANGNRTITFTFSEAVTGFDEADIQVSNGTLEAGSLTTTNDITWTARVVLDASGVESNVAVRVAANAARNADNEGHVAVSNQTTLAAPDTTDSNGIRVPDGTTIPASLNGFDFTNWDTSHVTSMFGTFYQNATFNQDISGWDVSSVTDMRGMFNEATAFNRDISGWNVSNVTDMVGMFLQASAFDRDIGGWDVSNVTDMTAIFGGATAFNQDISGWDVSNVTNMQGMFGEATAFNQDISGWNVSNVTTMDGMFSSTGMSLANMDATLRGWAKIDTGETALQNNVSLGLYGVTYSDATALQHLVDEYSWTIDGGTLDAGVLVGDQTEGNTTSDTLGDNGSSTTQILHGLGGNDTLTGGSGADFIVGGAGDDTLTGGDGQDTFDYGFSNAGSDTLTDFTSDAGGDIIDISDLLIGYSSASSTLSDYITATGSGGDTVLRIDHDGAGSSTSAVEITLQGHAYSASLLQDLITDGNLVL